MMTVITAWEEEQEEREREISIISTGRIREDVVMLRFLTDLD